MATYGISYNKEMNHSVQNAFLPDSLQAAPVPPPPANLIFDSLWASLRPDQRSNILMTAQRNAQQNQRTVLQFESDLHNRLRWISLHKIEYHRKYTLSLACLIFFFIGAPLGAIIRKGGFGTPVVVSVLMFISYYLVSMIGEKVAREGVWMVSTAMWFSTWVFFIIGMLLTNLAVTDSLLLNTENYNRLVEKLKLTRIIDFRKKTFADENSDPDQ